MLLAQTDEIEEAPAYLPEQIQTARDKLDSTSGPRPARKQLHESANEGRNAHRVMVRLERFEQQVEIQCLLVRLAETRIDE